MPRDPSESGNLSAIFRRAKKRPATWVCPVHGARPTWREMGDVPYCDHEDCDQPAVARYDK